MSRSRTLGPLAIAALLVIAVLIALRLRSGTPSTPEIPSQAQAAPERGLAPSPTEVEEDPARRAVESETSSAAKSAADPKPAACLTVELVAGGRPARGGEIRLLRGGKNGSWNQTVDPTTGCARFENLAPGTYRIYIPQTPQGFLPPRVFQRPMDPDVVSRDVRMAGEDRTVRFELEAAVHVFGDVRAPNGQLVKSAQLPARSSVQVRCWRKSASRAEEAGYPCFDVIDGHYEGDLYEGLWVFYVYGMPPLDSAGSPDRCVQALGALRLLPPASITQLDFNFRPLGSARLRGRILDEQGQPFEGVRGKIQEMNDLVEPTTRETLSWLHWQSEGDGGPFKSDLDGRFEFANLTPGHYMLSFEREGYSPLGSPEQSRLGELPPKRTLEVTGQDSTIELTVRRAHPAHVRGTVTLDAEWARSHGSKDLFPSLMVVYATGREDQPEARIGVQCRWVHHDFDFWIDASLTDPRLEFTLLGEKLVLPLTLSTTGDPAPLVIHFPR